METITLPVQGMTCGGCVRSVTRVLTAIEGVSSVDVILDKAAAHISYDSAKVDAERLKQAVREAGYVTS